MAKSYADHRGQAAARQGQISARGRDIAPIPPIADIARRKRCADSLRLFCETYNPAAFALGWSKDHLKAIARIEEAARFGALYAFAMPRGSGKTTICRMAALWASSYALRRYVFVIGANASKAEDTISSIQTVVRFLPDYAVDFPEISYPARSLNGIANRAKGQTCDGESTCIEWAKERIILPTVPPPENWPKEWALRTDGMVPTSGIILSASGLTGDGIRGSLMTLTTGEQVRPDFVLLDDPQTPESAYSLTQCQTRTRLVSADVLGMAGPGKTISAVMPCTVIRPGDMVDEILDRVRHPLWRGERTRMLASMPTNLDAWDAYFERYQEDAQREPPDFSASTAHYLAHQAELEAGAVASWPERKLPGEVSAVQHAMHIYCRDRLAFFAEYQNDPQPLVETDHDDLTTAQVMERLNQSPRGQVPAEATRVVAFIDVQQTLLYWTVCGWSEEFGGDVIDYGAYPDQQRAYFSLKDARRTLADLCPSGGLEAQLHAGLDALTRQLCGRDWKRADGSALRLSRCLIDSGYQSEVVHAFCRRSPHASVLLGSKGMAIGPSQRPLTEWTKKPGDRQGLHWHLSANPLRRLLIYDTNHWKSFLRARLATIGTRGALHLFGGHAQAHRLFADHLTSEYSVRTEGRGRSVDVWALRPNRPDNHYLDCLVGCAVAASLEGCKLTGAGEEGRETPARKESWKQIQARKQAERKR